MAIDQNSVILHNYPQSPVAEKVRAAFGIKGLTWASVEIPRIPPKPLLTQLTGGYRRTPVMQIGAEIFCDSHCILREVERRHPSPSFFPAGDEGLQWHLSRWIDGALFSLVVKVVLGSAGDALPSDFAEDRGRLYLGPNWAEALAAANDELPHLAAQLRAPLAWLEAQLGDGRAFLTGPAASMFDAQIWHVVWFARGRWASGPAFLSEFPRLEAWEDRMAAIGSGKAIDLDPAEALSVAAAATPETPSGVADHDPQGLRVGEAVTINPDLDGGEQPVAGTIWAADPHRVVIAREDVEVGALLVHFPRAGYRVERSLGKD